MIKWPFPVFLVLLNTLPAQETNRRGDISDRHGNVLATTDAEGRRLYPFGAAAAHTLGYTGRMKAEREGIISPRVGRSGVERQLEGSLAKGDKVRLTLDMRLQLAAEQAMRRVGAGCAVVTDPDSGEILAMVSVPSFDPNDFTPSITLEVFETYLRNPAQPLFDVVNAAQGTARRAQLEGNKVCGKTATSQWGDRKYLAWFSGWAGDREDKSQRYAITVVVENGRSGGQVAAPLARMILADCLSIGKSAPDKKLTPERLAPAGGHVEPIQSLDER